MVWIVIILVVALAGIQIFLHFNPYYSLAPGTALDVGQLITVPSSLAHPNRKDPIFLTDVLVTKVGAFNLVSDLFKSNVTLVPGIEITGGAPPGQVNQQNLLEMSDSKQNAEVAGLRRLGYQVPKTDGGAVVVQVVPHSAAAGGGIQVGDDITAIDGAKTTTAQALVSAILAHHPGDKVTLSVSQGGGQAPVTKTIVLGAHQDPSSGRSIAYMGIATSTLVHYDLPVAVKVSSAGIGGPSAGLAFTLGIIDELAPASVTGGVRIAATGTIDALGNVGDVGGVAQKTIAVRNAGATVFLVPPQEYKVALAHAGQHLKVFAVSSLNQALDVLHSLGGVALPAAPAPPGSGSAAPTG